MSVPQSDGRNIVSGQSMERQKRYLHTDHPFASRNNLHVHQLPNTTGSPIPSYASHSHDIYVFDTAEEHRKAGTLMHDIIVTMERLGGPATFGYRHRCAYAAVELPYDGIDQGSWLEPEPEQVAPDIGAWEIH